MRRVTGEIFDSHPYFIKQNNMKNIIKFIFTALMFVTLASCTEKGPDGPGKEDNKLNDKIKFTVKALKVEGTSAAIKVEHDGTEADTWYGFATTEANAMDAYQKKAAELQKSGNITGLSNKTTQTIQLNDLEPKKNYNYIVFGITADGELYGMPAYASFTTESDEVKMVENDAWSIEYTGLQEYEGANYHTATVTSSDENTYIITAYEKIYFEYYDIIDLAFTGLENYKYAIEIYNEKNNADMKLEDVLCTGNYTEVLSNIYASGTEWQAIAIGVDGASGELSGYYALSEPFMIQEEEPTTDYLDWIGDWTWTGANGKTFDITFEKGVSNISYIMTGWEPLVGLPVEVSWYKSEEEGVPGGWGIHPMFYGTYEFTDENGQNAEEGDLYLVGSYTFEEQAYLLTEPSLPICFGGLTENNERMCIASQLQDGQGNVITMDDMFFLGVFADGQYYMSTYEDIPSFPITITKRESTEGGNEGGNEGGEIEPTSLKVKKSLKSTKLPKIIRTDNKTKCDAIRK